MNLIIGFGDTEKRCEEQVEEAIRTHVAEQYAERSDCYFTDEFALEMRKWVNGMAIESQAAGEMHKHADTFPDRYSYFWACTISDASHLVFILKFHHINRRHAFSPDGWAMFRSERVFYVDTEETGRLRKKAA